MRCAKQDRVLVCALQGALGPESLQCRSHQVLQRCNGLEPAAFNAALDRLRLLRRDLPHAHCLVERARQHVRSRWKECRVSNVKLVGPDGTDTGLAPAQIP
eukprot:1130540-Rhodomonas_salina.3